jgi:HAD superfamily hydrolase (TIGR01509 family)
MEIGSRGGNMESASGKGNESRQHVKYCIDTVIFDLGAVLTDHLHPRAVLARYSIPYGENEKRYWDEYKLGRCTELEFWKGVARGTMHDGNEEQVMLEVRDLFTKAEPIGGYPFVRQLKEQGYNVAILSNHSREWGRGTVVALGLDALCDPIIISAEIGLAKPDPAIYDYSLRAVGRKDAPWKCLFIDDKERNILAAVQAGINGIVFTGAESLESELRRYDIRR